MTSFIVESSSSVQSPPTGVSKVSKCKSIRFIDNGLVRFQVYDKEGSAYVTANIIPINPPTPCPTVIDPPTITSITVDEPVAIIAGTGIPGAELIINGEPSGIFITQSGAFSATVEDISPNDIITIGQAMNGTTSSNSYVGIAQSDNCEPVNSNITLALSHPEAGGQWGRFSISVIVSPDEGEAILSYYSASNGLVVEPFIPPEYGTSNFYLYGPFTIEHTFNGNTTTSAYALTPLPPLITQVTNQNLTLLAYPGAEIDIDGLTPEDYQVTFIGDNNNPLYNIEFLVDVSSSDFLDIRQALSLNGQEYQSEISRAIIPGECSAELITSTQIDYFSTFSTVLTVNNVGNLDQLQYSLDYGVTWITIDNPSNSQAIEIPDGIYPPASIRVRAIQGSSEQTVIVEEGVMSPGRIVVENAMTSDGLAEFDLTSIPGTNLTYSVNGVDSGVTIPVDAAGNASINIPLENCQAYVVEFTSDRIDFTNSYQINSYCPPIIPPFPSAEYGLINQDTVIIAIPDDQWSDYYQFSFDGGQTWNNRSFWPDQIVVVPDGILTEGSVQVRIVSQFQVEGPTQRLSSIIQPYQPHDPVISENGTHMSFLAAPDHLITARYGVIIISQGPVDKYCQYQFDIPEVADEIRVTMTDPNNEISSTTIYQV